MEGPLAWHGMVLMEMTACANVDKVTFGEAGNVRKRDPGKRRIEVWNKRPVVASSLDMRSVLLVTLPAKANSATNTASYKFWRQALIGIHPPPVSI